MPRPAATRRYLTSRQDAGWRRLIDGVEAQRQRLAAQRAVMARPERDVRIDGQWFSVVWDGRGSLYGEAG